MVYLISTQSLQPDISKYGSGFPDFCPGKTGTYIYKENFT
jgi:hypothetical protein